jgi:hypothetical protein
VHRRASLFRPALRSPTRRGSPIELMAQYTMDAPTRQLL